MTIDDYLKVQMLKSKVQIKFKKQKNHESNAASDFWGGSFELGTLNLFCHLDFEL